MIHQREGVPPLDTCELAPSHQCQESHQGVPLPEQDGVLQAVVSGLPRQPEHAVGELLSIRLLVLSSGAVPVYTRIVPVGDVSSEWMYLRTTCLAECRPNGVSPLNQKGYYNGVLFTWPNTRHKISAVLAVERSSRTGKRDTDILPPKVWEPKLLLWRKRHDSMVSLLKSTRHCRAGRELLPRLQTKFHKEN